MSYLDTIETCHAIALVHLGMLGFFFLKRKLFIEGIWFWYIERVRIKYLDIKLSLTIGAPIFTIIPVEIFIYTTVVFQSYSYIFTDIYVYIARKVRFYIASLLALKDSIGHAINVQLNVLFFF